MYRTVATRRSVLAIFATGFLAPAYAASQQTRVIVHKDPNCGCCSGWVRHLREAGFDVGVEETQDLATIRRRLKVPPRLAACHTAEFGEYVVEGHVPAAAVRRLLNERPDATGLAVPGMPVGSPGMEGGKAGPYDVILFGASGARTFMRFVGNDVIG